MEFMHFCSQDVDYIYVAGFNIIAYYPRVVISEISTASRVCLVSNIGWLVISTIGVVGSLSHSEQRDFLFVYRYSLSLLSSVISILALKFFHQRALGKLSVWLFVPFIFLQLTEIYIELKCQSNLDMVSYWGVECQTLLIFPDGAKLAQVVTDELAVFLLSLFNLVALWRCHYSYAYQVYGKPAIKKKYKPLLSDQFVSAEDGTQTVIPLHVFLFLTSLFP